MGELEFRVTAWTRRGLMKKIEWYRSRGLRAPLLIDRKVRLFGFGPMYTKHEASMRRPFVRPTRFMGMPDLGTANKAIEEDS